MGLIKRWQVENSETLELDADNEVEVKDGSITPAKLSFNTFEHIETITLSSASASVTFSNLPDYYKLYMAYIRAGNTSTDPSPAYRGINVRLNNDSGTNYNSLLLYANGSSVNTVTRTGQTSMELGTTSNYGDNLSINILYIQQPYNNRVTALGIYFVVGSEIGMKGGYWYPTTATSITDITFLSSADSFRAGSIFSLYGLRL